MCFYDNTEDKGHEIYLIEKAYYLNTAGRPNNILGETEQKKKKSNNKKILETIIRIIHQLRKVWAKFDLNRNK